MAAPTFMIEPGISCGPNIGPSGATRGLAVSEIYFALNVFSKQRRRQQVKIRRGISQSGSARGGATSGYTSRVGQM